MNKIITKSDLARLDFSQMIFVSGSFDLLHLGHMRYLQASKNIKPEYTLLVVAISDEDIKRRKGENRPLFKLSDRVEALGYLEPVDYVLGWDQPWQELRQLVAEYKPAIMTVVEGDPGVDDKRNSVEEYGGVVHTINKMGDYSSSNIILALD